MSVRLTVQFRVLPGKSDEFEAVARPATAQVRAEDAGCETYELFRSLDDETCYVLIESWSSAGDLEKHGSSPGVTAMRKVRPLLAAPSVRHLYQD